jgi:hypothetical protein
VHRYRPPVMVVVRAVSRALSALDASAAASDAKSAAGQQQNDDDDEQDHEHGHLMVRS